MKKIIPTIIIVFIINLTINSSGFSSHTKISTIYVDDDGGADYTRIQDAIDAASIGDTIYVYSGNYVENIIVNKELFIEGEGRDITFIDGGEDGSVVTISAVDVSFSGFTVTNSRNSSRSAGIFVSDDRTSICDCFIVRNLGYGIYIEDSDNHLIVGNIVDRNNYDGICLISSSGNQISDNIVTDHFYWIYRIGRIPRSHGIYLYDVADTMVLNNSFRDNINSDLSLISSTSLTIRNNYFIGGSGITLFGDLEEMNSHMIEGNVVNDKSVYYFKNDHIGGVVPSDAGQVILVNCQNYLISDLEVDGGDFCILLGYSSYNTIEGNVISNVMDGFYLFHSDHNVISGNTIYNAFGNPTESSSFNIIKDNIIYNNYRYGFGLFYSSNNTIYQNSIYNNSEDGILIVDSRNNIVSLNEIDDNPWSGINLYMSPSNIITGNTISSNYEYGIKSLSSSNNNLIHHNNFINNNPNNVRDSCRNTWYLEDLGGNYWDDYVGNDSNNDGFGDQPYSFIGGSNSDNLPLMDPVIIYYPDKPDKPVGPSSGKIKEEIIYSFCGFDPEGSYLYYLVDWGDEPNSMWMGPFPSNVSIDISHVWHSQGEYSIRVKTRNVIGAESEWSDTLVITMPKNNYVLKIMTFILDLLERDSHIFPILWQILRI